MTRQSRLSVSRCAHEPIAIDLFRDERLESQNPPVFGAVLHVENMAFAIRAAVRSEVVVNDRVQRRVGFEILVFLTD